jgi:hypothetical protein
MQLDVDECQAGFHPETAFCRNRSNPESVAETQLHQLSGYPQKMDYQDRSYPPEKAAQQPQSP